MGEESWLSKSWKAMFPGEERFNDLLLAKGDGFVVATRDPEIFKMVVNGDLPFAPTMYPEGFHAVTRDGLTHISTEEDYLRLYDEDFRIPGWIDHTADWVGETYDWFNGKDPTAWEEGQLDDMLVIARDGFVISTRDPELMEIVKAEIFPMTPTQFPDPFKAVTRDGITQVSTEQDYLDGVEKGKPFYVPPKNKIVADIPAPKDKPPPPLKPNIKVSGSSTVAEEVAKDFNKVVYGSSKQDRYIALNPEMGLYVQDSAAFKKISDHLDMNRPDAEMYDHVVEEMVNNRKTIPQDLHAASVIAETLLGNPPAPYLLHLGFSESTLGEKMGAPEKGYGPHQFFKPAVLDALIALKEHPASHEIAKIMPEINKADRYLGNDKKWHYTYDGNINKMYDAVRTDPYKSTFLAAGYTFYNAKAFQTNMPDFTPTTKHYHIAHFLGPSYAKEFVEKLKASPNSKAYTMFPEGLKANQVIENENVFINPKTGKARTFAQMDKFFTDEKGIPDSPLKIDLNYEDENFAYKADGISIVTGRAAMDMNSELAKKASMDIPNNPVVLAYNNLIK